MPKAKLTMQSISFLVETYEDKTKAYRFIDIQKMIEEKFKISVTSEGVRKAYHRHKNDTNSKPEEVTKTKEKTKTVDKDTPKISMSELRGIVKKKSTNQKEFDTSYEDISNVELESLFTSSKDNQE